MININLSKEFSDLICKCWDPNPSKRPTSRELVDSLLLLENKLNIPQVTPLSSMSALAPAAFLFYFFSCGPYNALSK
jgi:hypothetical protein